MRKVFLCKTDQLKVGEVCRFELEGAPAVALVRCDDGFHAVVDNCSHEDFPLSEGEVLSDSCEIECAHHGSTFSLLDGEPQSLPATRPVPVLQLEVEGEDLYIDLPEVAP